MVGESPDTLRAVPVLAGELFRGFEFARSGDSSAGVARTGEDHINEGRARVERWLDLRLKFGFSEWNAPGYYNEDFPPLFNLVDFCKPDDPAITSQDERAALERIRIKAAMVLDLMIFDCARFTCRGSFGATAGRAYWEHKAYGWEQSIGNIIEILFGTRGDFLDTEPAAVALATSSYQVPEALPGIGLDRVVLDQSQPFTDRTRVSIDFDEAAQYKIGFESEEDTVFWWGLEAYYTDRTLELTKEIIKRHPNLNKCGPFELLYAISSNWMVEALVNLISLTLDYLKVRLGVALVTALPFPLDLVAVAIEGKNIVVLKGLQEVARFPGILSAGNGASVQAMDADTRTGEVYVVDSSKTIRKFKEGKLESSTRIGDPNDTEWTAVRVHPQSGNVYLVASRSNTRQAIVLHDGKDIAHLPVGHFPLDLKIDPFTGNVYVSNFYDGTVTVINGTDELDTIQIGLHASAVGINPQNGWVYVVDTLQQTISVLGYGTAKYTPAPTRNVTSAPSAPTMMPTKRSYP